MSEPRNLVQFTTDDVNTLIGRHPTDDEYRRLVKALPFSTMGEAFQEVVWSICGYAPDEEDD